MTRVLNERRMLQGAVAVAAIVPVAGGLFGSLVGSAFTQSPIAGSPDSHYRYLSGLLLGIGLCFWWLVGAIEIRTTLFRVLTLIVVVGGIGRLIGLVVLDDMAAPTMLGGLVMELVVTPLLCLWQGRIARLSLAQAQVTRTD